jgi:hypothetical protein
MDRRTHAAPTPGQARDGTFDGAALTNWLEKVRGICAQSGHLGIALSQIGRVLVYAPPDPGGLWLHEAAAAALNAKDAGDMRDGFRTELFNSRGVYTLTGGTEERKLAEKYSEQAEQLESSGYHRLASCVRDLAGSYRRDAERQEAEEPYED